MSKAIRVTLRCGILALSFALAGAGPIGAQVRVTAVAAPASNNQKMDTGVGEVRVLDVLPWDLPGVGGGFVVPQTTEYCDSQYHRRAAVLTSDPIIPLRAYGQYSYWNSRTGWSSDRGISRHFH